MTKAVTLDAVEYLICKYGMYYRPNAQGYTGNVAEAGRYTLAEAIRHSHPNGPDGPRDGMTYKVAPAVPPMTDEDHRLEDLKQMAKYSGPIVSFDVQAPYYLASCDQCGWVGSSELCGTDSFGDDSDVYCPRCHKGGADCGMVAERLASMERSA